MDAVLSAHMQAVNQNLIAQPFVPDTAVSRATLQAPLSRGNFRQSGRPDGRA